jgi:hypothetical protein
MELLASPTLETRPVTHTLGIRLVTPFRGMLATRDRLWAELRIALAARGITGIGPQFLRLHVIDMRGLMDIEAGVVVHEPLPGDGRVVAGHFPAGTYATLTHRDHSLRANKMLLDWTAQSAIPLDKHSTPQGDHFACRYELILSDVLSERKKTQWIVQINLLTGG